MVQQTKHTDMRAVQHIHVQLGRTDIKDFLDKLLD